MTIKTQIAGSPQTTTLTAFTLGTSTTLKISNVAAVPTLGSPNSSTNYITIVNGTGQDAPFATLEYTAINTAQQQLTISRVVETNAQNGYDFPTGSTAFRPYCAADCSDIAAEIAAKVAGVQNGNGDSLVSGGTATIPTATNNTLGMVKIGSGININNGEISVTGSSTQIYAFTIGSGASTDAITYSEAAANLTEAQRRAVVRSLAHHAIVNNGQIVNWLYNDNLGYTATDYTGTVSTGNASDLTGAAGDVMLLYEPIWWTVSHVNDGNTTIRFSTYKFSPDAVTAHQYGTTICSWLGLGVFEGIISSSALRSMNSSAKPTASITNDAAYTAAVYGRTNGHYNQMLPMTWTLYAILLLFEGGDRNTQAKWGAGYTKSTNTASTNVNSDWSAAAPWCHATPYTDGVHGVTAGGIQNMWGNVWIFLGEFWKGTNNVAHFTITGGSDHAMISTSPAYSGSCQMTGVSAAYIKDIIGSDTVPFLPRTTGAAETTYWADYCYSNTTQSNCGIVGGYWNYAALAGLFLVHVYYALDHSNADLGARLQILIE
ncbi:MAG TPA: hypothetical protein O0X39_01335 [Methanocorpusculum sp.]|nr:hypothetical protein [Methanocorpusculum sp.]